MNEKQAEITAFWDRWAEECRKNGTVAMAVSHVVKPYGGFGSLTIGEENAAYEDMRRQCEKRGLVVIAEGPYFITKAKTNE